MRERDRERECGRRISLKWNKECERGGVWVGGELTKASHVEARKCAHKMVRKCKDLRFVVFRFEVVEYGFNNILGKYGKAQVW